MTFTDLDARMRTFEATHDPSVLPGLYRVVRLDGRGFTKLTKETHDFEAPFDPRMRDHMVSTVRHLMEVGFRVVLGYTQSDEISLLLHRDGDAFSRKLRKTNSVLAGEASAHFSLQLGGHGVFDSRVSQLPDFEHVVDYFAWRQADASRNALSAHAYWALRRDGLGARAASEQTEGMSASAKNELLFARGINFDALPAWQKRGLCVFWGQERRKGHNPVTGEDVEVERRVLKVDDDLPRGDAWMAYIRGFREAAGEVEGRTAQGA